MKEFFKLFLLIDTNSSGYKWTYVILFILLEIQLKTNPVSCELCTQAVGYLDSVLTEKSTEDEIKKEVESLCSNLPDAFKNEVFVN